MNYGVINEKPNSNEANFIREKVFAMYVAQSWNVVFEIFSNYEVVFNMNKILIGKHNPKFQ